MLKIKTFVHFCITYRGSTSTCLSSNDLGCRCTDIGSNSSGSHVSDKVVQRTERSSSSDMQSFRSDKGLLGLGNGNNGKKESKDLHDDSNKEAKQRKRVRQRVFVRYVLKTKICRFYDDRKSRMLTVVSFRCQGANDCSECVVCRHSGIVYTKIIEEVSSHRVKA